jgi:hypothetical protein
VVQLRRDADKIRAAGAELIFIGNGGPSFIEGFREQTGWTGPLYTDPSLEVFKTAQLKRGIATVINPKAILPTLRALGRGARQGLTRGDNWQQGGVLVIVPTGDVRWHHASERPGDNATAEQILAALA